MSVLVLSRSQPTYFVAKHSSKNRVGQKSSSCLHAYTVLAPSNVSLLAISDLFVLPSDYEGFGVVIAEALSVGINVVSTDCQSGPREILNNGELGYLCEVDNPEDLAKSIKEALDEPINKEKLIRRSKDFSVETVGMQYQALIENS